MNANEARKLAKAKEKQDIEESKKRKAQAEKEEKERRKELPERIKKAFAEACLKIKEAIANGETCAKYITTLELEHGLLAKLQSEGYQVFREYTPHYSGGYSDDCPAYEDGTDTFFTIRWQND